MTAVLLADAGQLAFSSLSHTESALLCFDAALLLDPERKPYLWQRGLVLYYLKRFDDAIVQFASDFEANCIRLTRFD